MCTNSASSPASMRKRKVTFFDRVRIREIQVQCSNEWSDTDDDELLDSDFEYQTDLVRDLGDYDEALNTEPKKSMSAKYSSKSRSNSSKHTLDWSGKIYSSAAHNDFQVDRIDSKFLLLPSLKADRWKSSSPSITQRKRIPQYQQPELSLSKSDLSDDSIDFNDRLHRIKEEGRYFQKGTISAPMRRPSSTESLNRTISKQSGSRGSSSNWKRITSAPTLMRRKGKGSKNRPTLAESRNATFGSSSTNTRPPLLPTRWNSRKNIFLLERVNENSEKRKNLNRLSDISDSSHTTATSSTSTTNNPDCDDYKDDSDEFGEREVSEKIPPVAVESPKTNRRNLLQRSMGSLRSLASKSPKSRSKKGRNDMPPKRPIRLSSVRTLQIEDL